MNGYLVKSISIQNADTAAATVTIIYNNNSTLRNILVATLAVGDQLIYEDGNGWLCLDKNGNLKTSATTVTPGGFSGQVQYNNAGAFGGLANGQLPGTATNDNANAGNIGEFISATLASGSAVSLTNATAANITSISLTAGDWDVTGNIQFTALGTHQGFYAAINTVSATFPSAPNSGAYNGLPLAGSGQIPTLPTGTIRLSLSGTTTVYLIGQANFTTSTCSAFGFIGARRRR